MTKCSFCNKVIKPSTGIMVIQKTGKILYFDNKKCEKNMLKLRRDARNFKWTKEK